MLDESDDFELLPPNLDIFIESLRDIGYSLDTAVADVIDNSITARAKHIQIYALPSLKALAICDDGEGMGEAVLKESMRLGTKRTHRERGDLGHFGLGLKTASFSQCKKLTVFSKTRKDESFGFSWDLKLIARDNNWLLQRITIEDKESFLNKLSPQIIEDYDEQNSGTIVLWECIDRYTEKHFQDELVSMRAHIALVFHQYLDFPGYNNRLCKICLNGQEIHSCNPFKPLKEDTAYAMQRGKTDELSLSDGSIFRVTPYVLPPLSKLSKKEFGELGTTVGFTSAQGFYLYREGRLLVYGTWFGLTTVKDASNLARIKIDIDNTQDEFWKIDVKKSLASPVPEIKEKLKHYVSKPSVKSRDVHKGRGILKKEELRPYWNEVHVGELNIFKINREHPEFLLFVQSLSSEQREKFTDLLNRLETCLPIDRIHSVMTTDLPNVSLPEVGIDDLVRNIREMKARGLSKSQCYKELMEDCYFQKVAQEIEISLEAVYG